MKGMGSMKKRIMAALLVLCMVFSLVGCVDVHVSHKVTKDGVVRDYECYN